MLQHSLAVVIQSVCHMLENNHTTMCDMCIISIIRQSSTVNVQV